MNNTKKLEILSRLTKDGDITLEEALILLETEKEYIFVPEIINPYQSISFPPQPYVNPNPILGPNSPDWTYRPGTITYSLKN